jgi:hypothetical protein
MFFKKNNNFIPVNFQSALAAGGVSLMPYNYLHFNLPHEGKMLLLSDVAFDFSNLNTIIPNLIMILIMAITVSIHLYLTSAFLFQISNWSKDKEKFNSLIDDPYRSSIIFPVIGSLSMSLNVIWAPLNFFLEFNDFVAKGITLISSIIFFILLFYTLKFYLRIFKSWKLNEIKMERLNFVWVLDSFALGLVTLSGSGLSLMVEKNFSKLFFIYVTFFVALFGMSMLVYKLFRLSKKYLIEKKMPDLPILPAFFLVVPILCLYGIGLYRILPFFNSIIDKNHLVSVFYLASILYILLFVYLLRKFIFVKFKSEKYSPTQWGMV